MSGLEELIGTLGFPVAITVFLLWERTKERGESRVDRKEAIEAITNNTKALILLEKAILQGG